MRILLKMKICLQETHFFLVYIDLFRSKPEINLYVSRIPKEGKSFLKFIMESNVPNFSSSCGTLKVGREIKVVERD